MLCLRRAMGEAESGAALLAAAAADRETPLSAMRATAAGQARLGRLAAVLQRRFSPGVRAAREAVEGCPETAAWARGLLGAAWPPAE